MSVTIQRKRGDSFRLRFKKDGGLEGVIVEAVLRNSVQTIALQPAILDPAEGIFELTLAGDTASWPTGRLACDIKYTREGQVVRSETFFVQILEAMTP